MSCLSLKKSNCKNCYKCIRNCPIKSIRISGNQAHTIDEECILCGRCYAVCPQNATQIVSEVEKVKMLLMGGEPVVVSLAPSFVANYDGCGIETMREAIMKLGFADVQETAQGATMVKTEYERIIREDGRDIIISSCCHSVNLLIQKYYPSLIGLIAEIDSPMLAHCKEIKRRNPLAKTVFIGPCIAKKDEAERYGDIVDAVLTFEELTAWLKESDIEIRREMDSDNKSKARLFPTTGGVLKTMDKSDPTYKYIAIDGIEKCVLALDEIMKGNVHKCFIEMSACRGSCVNGPIMERHNHVPLKDWLAVANYAGFEDFEVYQPSPEDMKKAFDPIDPNKQFPTEEEILSILRQMGKRRPADELNCGSCGYNSCREKAIAIYQGKAEISMCLPYLKDKAESFSDHIINNTPNGIIVLNANLEVQQINKTARKILNIRSASDVMGEPVVRILDPQIFANVRDTGRTIEDQRIFLAEYGRYVEQTVSYDRDYNIVLCIMRDVTDEEKEKEKKEALNLHTVEVADRVIEKQMRVVQEIASLLGETAAETKIALAKLKESIENE